MSAIPQLILAADPKKSNGSVLGNLLPLVVLAVVAVLFLRSRKKQKLRTQVMRNSIEVGQRVMTTSGILATVVGSDDETYSLEVADGVVITFVKRAVTKVVPPPDNPDHLDQPDQPVQRGDGTPDTVPDQVNVSSDG